MQAIAIDIQRAVFIIVHSPQFIPFFIENEVHNGIRAANADIRQIFRCFLHISALFIVKSLEFIPHVLKVGLCILKCVSLLEIIVHYMVDNENRKSNCEESSRKSSGDRRPFPIKNGHSLPVLPGHQTNDSRTGHKPQAPEKDHRNSAVPDHLISPVHIIPVCQKDCVHVKVFHYSAYKEGLSCRRTFPFIKKDSHKRSEDACKHCCQAAGSSRKTCHSKIHACVKSLSSGEHSRYDSCIGVKKETRREGAYIPDIQYHVFFTDSEMCRAYGSGSENESDSDPRSPCELMSGPVFPYGCSNDQINDDRCCHPQYHSCHFVRAFFLLLELI